MEARQGRQRTAFVAIYGAKGGALRDNGTDGASAGMRYRCGRRCAYRPQGRGGADALPERSTAQLHLGVPPPRRLQVHTIRRLSESIRGFSFAPGGRIGAGRYRPRGPATLGPHNTLSATLFGASQHCGIFATLCGKCGRMAAWRRMRLQRNPLRPLWACGTRQGYAGRGYRVRFEYRRQATGFGEDR